MQQVLDFFKENAYIIVLMVNIILMVWLIINTIKINKTKKIFNDYLEKIGDGVNFQKTLNKYINRVEQVDDNLNELGRYCEKINHNMAECIQKVGVIRYSNSKDSINDYNFSVSLLDSNNTGIILSGNDMNDFTKVIVKPIIKGSSRYNLDEHEKESIKKAIYNNDIGKIK